MLPMGYDEYPKKSKRFERGTVKSILVNQLVSMELSAEYPKKRLWIKVGNSRKNENILKKIKMKFLSNLYCFGM